MRTAGPHRPIETPIALARNATPPTVALRVDDLELTVLRSARRRTLQITVERDGALAVCAPPDVPLDALRDFVIEKRFWIYTQLAQRDRLRRSVPAKQFVNGEGFVYLGRSYRLKLVDDQAMPLKLAAGRFLLRQSDLPEARRFFIQWYSERARQWLRPKVDAYCARMGVGPAGVKVQDLGYRWGSCGKGDWLYFHWKTILLPSRIAEYVAVHEMAHLRAPHHTAAFWAHVERVMPDYARRKSWLAEHGMDVEGL
jgi:predicted metal-dependent hydrolase